MAESRRGPEYPDLKVGDFARLSILGLLLTLCGLLYYFGEIIDFFRWDTLRWSFFYGVHDTQRLFFLAPVLYVAHLFGMRSTVIVVIVSAAVMIPRAVFISPYPDPMIRMLLSMAIISTMGYLTARNRRETRRISRLQKALRLERNQLSGILARIPDGVVIIGPDYRVRYANQSIVRDFGEGVGAYCYRYLYGKDGPCEICRMPRVIRGADEKWEHGYHDGRAFEVIASAYTDTDGTVCQLATYRNIAGR